MWNPLRRVVRPALLAIGALGLLGCSGEDDAAAAPEPVASAPSTSTTTSTSTTSSTTSTSSTTVPPTTVPPTTVPAPTLPPAPVAPAPTRAPAPPPPQFTGDPDTFRLPMNGRVNVTLAWDCGGCVVELGSRHHPAIDYKSRDDDTIVAAGHGRVVFVNDGCASPSRGCGQSMGNSIFLEHRLADGGVINTFYAHLAEIDPAVTMGACMVQGQRLGLMGNSGIGSAAHLHFAFQTTTDVLQYTVASSYESGSRNPDDFYGRVKVQPCG
jgi:murein DD-endopeptidase MepM/ murein hydrolase activator NlpD